MTEEDGFEYVSWFATRGHTKVEMERAFAELERKHLKEEAGFSDAAIEKWQKEGVIYHLVIRTNEKIGDENENDHNHL